jgi:hypothetical protein
LLEKNVIKVMPKIKIPKFNWPKHLWPREWELAWRHCCSRGFGWESGRNWHKIGAHFGGVDEFDDEKGNY